ncbi:MAG: hypothetical protein FD118_4117 [Rhodocyclaceae bacterium]|nr:MAG: hypothetical protein FD118_4117 [Rhodocyclaceae bacterium]
MLLLRLTGETFIKTCFDGSEFIMGGLHLQQFGGTIMQSAVVGNDLLGCEHGRCGEPFRFAKAGHRGGKLVLQAGGVRVVLTQLLRQVEGQGAGRHPGGRGACRHCQRELPLLAATLDQCFRIFSAFQGIDQQTALRIAVMKAQ